MKTDIKSVDAHTAKRLFDGGAHMVDVRSEGAWAAGHVEGSDLIAPGNVNVHSIGRADSVVAVCANGKKSRRAAKKLARAGYRVYHLDGGLTAWEAAGLPLESTTGKHPTIL